jgi:hypothetical protein
MAVVRTMVIIVALVLGWIAIRTETLASGSRPSPAALVSPVKLPQGSP